MNAKSIVRGGALLVGKTRSFLSAFLIIALLSGAAAPLVAFASGPVTGVTVSDADSGTVVSGDTDQMSATVAPVDATTKTVTWSVTNGSGSATIDPSSGLLTATGAGSVTVTATATDGSGVTGTENITVNPAVVVTTHTLTYTAGANGTITGDASQTVNDGSNGTAVTAVANSGYQFSSWSDSSTANPRTDSDVTADVSVTANFTAVTGTYAIPTEAPPYLVNTSATGVDALEAFVKTSGVSFANPGLNNLDAGWAATTVNPTFAAEYGPLSANLSENLNIAVGAQDVTVDIYAFTGCTTLPTSACPSTDLTDAYQVTFHNGVYAGYAALSGIPATDLAAENTAIPVTGVTLGEHTATLAIGATDQLTSTIAPVGATNQAVTYSSSAPTVASVDSSSGLVTANAAGTATITVTTTDGSKTDTDVITVNPAVVVTTHTLTYTAGANGTITGDASQTVNDGSNGTAVTAVANSGYQFSSWSDSSTANPRTDSDVTADVSVTANFTAVTGTYAIPTEAPPYLVNTSATGVDALEAFVKTSGVSFANPGLNNLDAGWAATTVNPTFAAEYGPLSANLSENLNIAVGAQDVTVDIYAFTGCTTLPTSACPSTDLTDAYQVTFSNGVYTGWTALSGDPVADLAAENDKAPAVLTTINVSTPTSMTVGDTQTLTASGLDQYSASIAMTPVWTSSDTSVATVDASSGVVTAVAAGTATITATDGSVSGTAIVAIASNLTALTAEIATANAALVGVVEGTVPGNHVVGSSATLTTAITAAQGVTDADAQSVVDAAVTTLTSAVSTFNAAIVGPSDVSALTTAKATAAGLITANAAESTTPGDHTVGALATLSAANTAANATDADAQSVVDGQVTTLDAAITAYNAAIVPAVQVTGVTLNESTNTLTVGNTDQLVATIAPVGATNQAVTYSSSAPTVASVDSSSGLVTANAAGTATITVTTTDGSFTATDAITINAAAVVAPVVSSGGGGGGGGGGVSGSYGQVSNGYGGYTTPGVTTVTTTSGTGGQVLGAAAYNFANNLTVGSTGNDVTQLQTILIAEGDLSIGTPSGYFGALTKAAVIKYQTAHGISPQSGYVGSLTRGVLNLGTTPTTPESNTGTTGSGLTSTQVQAIIGLLQSFGADATTIANVTAALNK